MIPRPVMIFAAGFGTRMGALTRDRPKPLIPVDGRPLIDHALAIAAAHNAPRIVVNLHYRGEMIAAHLAGRDVALSPEDPILETGGGLRHALPLLGAGPVMTLNSDMVWQGPNPLDLVSAAWDGARMDALLLLIPKGRAAGHGGRGDFLLAPDGRIARGPGDVYAGAGMIAPETLAAIPDAAFSLNPVWDRIASRGRLCGISYPGRWCDVGRPESIPLAEAMLNAD